MARVEPLFGLQQDLYRCKVVSLLPPWVFLAIHTSFLTPHKVFSPFLSLVVQEQSWFFPPPPPGT